LDTNRAAAILSYSAHGAVALWRCAADVPGVIAVLHCRARMQRHNKCTLDVW